jgi:glyoxylase-like metal-dependent hydrolase (beta-lactamase superfamily II)
VSEPRSLAHEIEQLRPGLYRWTVADERIGGAESDAYAVAADGRVTLVDPLPVDPRALGKLGHVEAIVLTAACHQRSAWRFRRRFGAPVLVPERIRVGFRAGEVEERPDIRYRGRDLLTAGLVAVHAPGPAEDMYALWAERDGGVLFVSDLLVHDEPGAPGFVPSEYQDAPARTRESVRWLAEHLPIEGVLFAHGPPILSGGREALLRALAEDGVDVRSPASPPRPGEDGDSGPGAHRG